jgi:hypothetical protein
MIARCSIHIPRRLDLRSSFIVIPVSNEDRTASLIHERFDPIPDMGRSIDARILVMRQATVDTTNFPNKISPALNRRHLSFQHGGMGRNCESRSAVRSGAQRALHDPSPKILLLRRSRAVATGGKQAGPQHDYVAPPRLVHGYSFLRNHGL